MREIEDHKSCIYSLQLVLLDFYAHLIVDVMHLLKLVQFQGIYAILGKLLEGIVQFAARKDILNKFLLAISTKRLAIT